MPREIIDLGTGPNTRTGAPLREAFRAANANFAELYPYLALIDALQVKVNALPLPDDIRAQVTLAIAQAIAGLPTPGQVATQISAAIAQATAGLPTAASIQAQIDAAVAQTNISNFYTKSQVDGFLSNVGNVKTSGVVSAGNLPSYTGSNTVVDSGVSASSIADDAFVNTLVFGG